jgi:hypothetical protein
MRGTVAKSIREAIRVTGKYGLYQEAKRNHKNLNNPQKPKFKLSKRQQRLLAKKENT